MRNKSGKDSHPAEPKTACQADELTVTMNTQVYIHQQSDGGQNIIAEYKLLGATTASDGNEWLILMLAVKPEDVRYSVEDTLNAPPATCCLPNVSIEGETTGITMDAKQVIRYLKDGNFTEQDE